MAWILIVTPTKALRLVISSAVRDVLQDPAVETRMAQNLAEAEGLVRHHGLADCRLVVCSPSVPRDADEAPAIDGRQLNGIAYARALRRAGPGELPIVFVGALADSERKEELATIANSRMVVFDERVSELLPLTIRAMLRPDEAVPPPRAAALEARRAASYAWGRDVDLDIALGSSSASWTIRSQDGGEEGGNIAIEPSQIRDLVDLSTWARGNPGGYLRVVGKSIFAHLMQDPLRNDGLRNKLQSYVGPAGLNRARIRFSVNEDTQRILLETLADSVEGRQEPDFWMLKSPIFRKLGREEKGVSLFRTLPINCLLILGETKGFTAAGELGWFDEIAQADKEIRDLKKFLDRLPPESGIGRVDVLRRNSLRSDFHLTVRDALRKQDYQLVHYAGHSALGPSRQPWLVFGSGEKERVHAADVAEWARGHLQFMFMSSCESANSQFIMHLVEHMPAVVGYAWHANDDPARAFTETFYERLFGDDRERHMLEDSFMAAKKALYRSDPETNDWAAPLLFMQIMEGKNRHAAATRH